PGGPPPAAAAPREVPARPCVPGARHSRRRQRDSGRGAAVAVGAPPPAALPLISPPAVLLDDYLAQATALRQELDERLAALEPGQRLDVVKGLLKDWRQRLDELQRNITHVPPDARRE